MAVCLKVSCVVYLISDYCWQYTTTWRDSSSSSRVGRWAGLLMGGHVREQYRRSPLARVRRISYTKTAKGAGRAYVAVWTHAHGGLFFSLIAR